MFKDGNVDTTRQPRIGEEDGKAYHFVDKEAFLKLRSENGFIETAEFAGNHYGTSKLAVKTVHDQGRRCILDIEAQVRFTRNLFPSQMLI